jgi:RNA polymerase sigma factor (sigma-70 family)
MSGRERLLMRLLRRESRNERVAVSPGLELDYEIARLIGDGKREGLEKLVDRQLSPLYRYLSRRLGPGQEELVEAVVTETFTEAMKKLHPYELRTTRVPMRLWFVWLTNRRLAHYRARIKNSRNIEGAESVALDGVRSAMKEMPPAQQSALSLALFEEMAPDEIASSLGTSPTRAMRLLRNALKRVGVEEPGYGDG